MGLKCGTINLLHVTLHELGLIAAALDSQNRQNNLPLTTNSVFHFILPNGFCQSIFLHKYVGSTYFPTCAQVQY